MSLGSLAVDISANTARLQSDLGKAARMFESSSQRMQKQAAIVGNAIGTVAAGLATGAFANWVKGAIDSADAAGKSAQAIGVTTEALTGLQYAASLSDITTAELNSGLLKFSKNIAEAANGTAAQAQAFADMGLSVKDAGGEIKSADALLLEVADKFAGYEDGAQKALLASDLFGKGLGSKVIPFLNDGAAGIETLTAQAQRFGLVMSKETTESAAQFNDSLTVMGAMTDGIALQVATQLLPTFNEFTGLLIDVSEDSETAAATSSFLSTMLKGTAIVAIALSTTFGNLGRAIGGYAAAAAAAASLDFKTAKSIIADMTAENEEATKKAEERMRKLWNGSYAGAGDAAAEAAKKLREAKDAAAATAQKMRETMGETKEAIVRHTESVATQAKTVQKATDAIQGQVAALQLQAATLGMSADKATLYKLAQDGATDSQLKSAKAALDSVAAFEKAAAAQEQRSADSAAAIAVEVSTYSDASKALADYQEKVETLRKGLLNGSVSQSGYDSAVAGLEAQMAAAEEKNKETTTAISAAWEGAAKNIQSTMADFLFDPFKGGLEGMVQGLGTAIQRMVADAVAADLANKLFGSAVGGTGDGWIGAAASFASSFFGGGKAIGGPVMAGKLYEVGENRPETFMSGGKQYLIPSKSGSISPNAAGNSTNNVINITLPNVTNAREARQARAELSRSITGAMGAAARYS